MSAAVRPLSLPGAAAWRAPGRRADAALAAWAADWLGEARPCVRVDAADAPAAGASFEARAGARGAMWFVDGPAHDRRLRRTLLGSAAPDDAAAGDDWIDALVACARGACRRALCDALLGPPAQADAAPPAPPRRLFAPFGGALRLECEDLGLLAIADPAAWRAAPAAERDAPAPALPALAPLEDALGGTALRLDVPLGGVELELGRLMALRRGDVLRLPRRLDETFTVFCEGRPFAQAVLGEARGRRAMQFTGDPR